MYIGTYKCTFVSNHTTFIHGVDTAFIQGAIPVFSGAKLMAMVDGMHVQQMYMYMYIRMFVMQQVKLHLVYTLYLASDWYCTHNYVYY